MEINTNFDNFDFDDFVYKLVYHQNGATVDESNVNGYVFRDKESAIRFLDAHQFSKRQKCDLCGSTIYKYYHKNTYFNFDDYGELQIRKNHGYYLIELLPVWKYTGEVD